MTKRKSFDEKRSQADHNARGDSVRSRSWPRLDPFAHGCLNEILDEFSGRLLDLAQQIAGTQTVSAIHLEQAYERLFTSSTPADWAVINRRRVYLIQQELTGSISAAEATELEALQVQADRHMAETTPRPLEALWDLERRIRDQ